MTWFAAKPNICRRRYRPLLEVLETRLAPAGVWDGGGGDNLWNTAANWDDNTLPSNIPVTIPAAFSGVTITSTGNVAITSLTSAASLTISNGTFDIAATSSINNAFTQSGGTLTGTGSLDIAGLTTWSGGTMSGSGVTNANGGLALSGAVRTFTGGRTLNNAGAATWTSGFFSSGGGAILHNLAGATFDIRHDAIWFHNQGGAVPTFTNDGTLTKSAGTGVAQLNVAVNNNHIVNIDSGTLELLKPGTAGAGSQFTGAGTLQFSGGYTLSTGSTVNMATVVFNAGTVTVNGSYTATVQTRITNGTADVGGAATFNTATLNQLGGLLTGGGTVNVSGQTVWSGGNMTGSGVTNANGGLHLSNVLLSGRTLNNAGAAVWSSGGFSVGGAVFHNLATGTFDLFFDGLMQTTTGGASTFLNDGTFTKSGGAGVGTLRFDTFINNGVLNVTSGTLSLGGGSSVTPGLVDVQNVTLGGSGTIHANVNNNGTVAPGQSPGTLTINGTYTQQAAGVLNIEVNGPATSEFDRLLVRDTATLAGTVNILRDAAYFPATGSLFRVIVAGSRTSTFATTTGTTIDADHFFAPQYTATDFDLTVGAIPRPPTVVNPIADLVRDEDAAAVFDHADLNNVFDDPNDPDSALTYTLEVNTPSGIVSAIIAPDGTLDLSFLTDQNGVVQITLRATDPDGQFAEDTFNVTVGAVNDAPEFTLAGDPPAVDEDAGPQTVASFATNIRPGPATATDEARQTLTFNVTVLSTTGNLAFSAGPAISTTGDLTYTPAAETNGTATVQLALRDNGSGVPPNANASAPRTFVIRVNAVNDAPEFTLLRGDPPVIDEDAGPQSVAGFAGDFRPGPAAASDEVGQTLVSFTVTVTSLTGNLSFTSAPAVTPDGALSYTAAAHTNGTATVTITVTDSGSGTPPNSHTSAPQTFVIRVTAINDAPEFTLGGDPPPVNEGAGAQSVRNFATNIRPGPVTATDEASQPLTFQVTVVGTTGNLAFSAGPAIDPVTGELTYAVAPNTNGNATVRVALADSGSGVLPNVNTSAPQTFTITVAAAPLLNPSPVVNPLSPVGNALPPVGTTIKVRVTFLGGFASFTNEAGLLLLDGGPVLFGKRLRGSGFWRAAKKGGRVIRLFTNRIPPGTTRELDIPTAGGDQPWILPYLIPNASGKPFPRGTVFTAFDRAQVRISGRGLLLVRWEDLVRGDYDYDDLILTISSANGLRVAKSAPGKPG